MQKSDYKIYAAALAVFMAVSLPVWTVRGCTAARENIIIIPQQQSETKTLPTETVELPGSFDIKVYDKSAKKTFSMDIEEYIVGVVSAEMPASFEFEALKAQAIAARTYTARKLKAFGGSGCSHGADVCTDSGDCQAYSSQAERTKSWGENAQKYEQKIRQAVSETAGTLVIWQNEPIEAFFHSTSGGMTEDSQNAFSEPLPYLKSVVSDEPDAPRYQNCVKMSCSKFAKKVNSAYPKAKLKASTLKKNVRIVSRFASGRAEQIALGKIKISAKQFRALLGLDSTNITFEFSGDDILIHTKGFGHGVGLSQTGANDLAKSGWSCEKILTYYYTGTSLDRRW